MWVDRGVGCVDRDVSRSTLSRLVGCVSMCVDRVHW